MIRAVRDELAAMGYSVTVDSLGNISAPLARSDAGSGPAVLLLAHTDEIGLIVRKVEADGFLRCERLGGVPERVLPGQQMLVIARDGGTVEAVVGIKSHHLTAQDEKYRVVPIEELYLDAGFAGRDEARSAGIGPGSPVVYARRYMRRGTQVVSPALDDRAGCAILLELAARLRGSELSCRPWLVFSVQEEFSLRGVLPAARRVRPDLAITVDLAVACDTPDLARTDVRLGAGPAIGMYSFHGRGTLAGVIPNPKLVQLVELAAARDGIPVQANVFFGGLTDGSFLQLENDGIPTVDIGFPTRYTHSPVECCDLRDLSGTVDLLASVLRSLPAPLRLARG